MDMAIEASPAELVAYIAGNLVKHKDEVETNQVITGSNLVVELRVNPEDLGTVIGKGGRIAKAVRTLLSSLSTRKLIDDQGQTGTIHRINLEIIDQ